MTSLYLARRVCAQQTYFSVYSRFIITVPFPLSTPKKTTALSETFMKRFPPGPTQKSACVFSFWGIKAKRCQHCRLNGARTKKEKSKL